MKLRLFDLFLVVSILCPFISFFYGNEAFDINLHDSYYVIPISVTGLTIGGLFLIMWILYRLFHRILLSQGLANLHVVTSLVALACFMKLVSPPDFLMPGRPYYAISPFDSRPQLLMVTTVAVLLSLISQLIFVVNILGGIIKQLVKKRRTAGEN